MLVLVAKSAAGWHDTIVCQAGRLWLSVFILGRRIGQRSVACAQHIDGAAIGRV